MKRISGVRPVWACLLFLSAYLCGLAIPAPAQNQAGSISGTLMDPAGAVLRGAQVSIPAKGMIVFTDQQGRFFFSGLEPGTYIVSISYIGFEKLTKTVTVNSGVATTVDLQLQVASKNQTVLVTAESASAQVEAVNEERAADNILQVMPVKTITSLPSSNLGDAIGRMPSVTVTRNEGEDQYVQIRGTEPRLNNTTVDGFNMPSEDPGVREFEFAAVPSGIVDSVQVSKTLQANMDGDGVGGSVNLVTKTASDTPTYEISALGGYNPIQNGRGNTQEYGTWGRRFGASNKLGFIMGGSYEWEGTGTNDLEPTPDLGTLPDGSTQTWFAAADLREYQFHRPRWGMAGALDFRVKAGSTIFLRYLYSDYHDFGDKTVYTLIDNTPSVILLNPGNSGCTGDLTASGATTGPCNTGPSFYNQNEHILESVGSVQLSGTHVLNRTWYSWSAAIGQGFWGGGWDKGSFNYVPDTSSCQYNPATKDPFVPEWSQGCYDEIADPANQVLSRVQYEKGASNQINIGVQGSGAFRWHLGGHLSTFEYGAKFRSLHKYDDRYKAYAYPTGNTLMSAFPNGLKDPNYYFGKFHGGGYNVFFAPIQKYVKQNPGQFTYSNDQWVDPSDYGLVEHIPGFYVMNSTDFRSGIRLVLGLRAEVTTDNVHNLAFDKDGNATPNRFSGSYYDILPSASLRFPAGPNSFLRLIYARGISRPEEQDLSQPLDWTNDGNGAYKLRVSFGNANLKAEVGDDIDVLYDHYFKTFGVLSGGYFYKHLSLPIVTTQTPIPNYLPPGAPPEFRGTYLATEPINAGSAWISGIELQYLQHWTSLPGFLGGLGMNANYSYIGSRTSGIAGRSDRPRLLNNAPNMFNIGPTYNKGPLSLNMGIVFNQASVFTYQYLDGAPGGVKGPLSDVYFYNYSQVDAQGGYKLGHGLELIVTGTNLNNEVFGFYQGSQQYQIQREYYQPTYSFGIRWSPQREQ